MFQDNLDNMKVLDLRESLEVGWLRIAEKKSNPKLRLQQAVATGVKIPSEE